MDLNELFNAYFPSSDVENLLSIISQLEVLVANRFRNHQERGSFDYRYPVSFKRDCTEYKARGGYIPDLSLEELDSVRYDIGSNSLYIGKALLDILKYLEYRYIGDLDFCKLERKYQEGYYNNKSNEIADKMLHDASLNIPLDGIFNLDN